MIIKSIYKAIVFLSVSILLGACNTTVDSPSPHSPIPTENQMRWQEMEYYAFIHYSINTYTDQEWGYGDNDPKLFNPTHLDCRQWARICKDAGMKGIILTAKHHDGFCLWPSQYTEYSVKNSPWKDGKGDLVKELADACKEFDLKLGIYISPWDRNRSDYGTPEYITYFRNQLREVMTNYGDIFEIWFDGAHGGNGYYGGARDSRWIDRETYYDWPNTYKLIREFQPQAVIWNDGGDRADLRWVGTEAGYVGETNWSQLYATGDVPEEMLRYGVEDGNVWVPGEVNTSIRPGWFYHEYEDTRVKKLPQLMDTYYNSIGRNGTLLLNFPIDRRGLIHENDEKEVLEFARKVKESFAVNLAEKAKIETSNVRGNSNQFEGQKTIDNKKDTYWATDDSVMTASLTIDFGKPTIFNRFMAQEYIRLGQRVKSFSIEAFADGQWKELAQETTIGYKRILRFPTVKASKLRFNITSSKACPVISNIGVYNAPPVLTPPTIMRDQSGDIHIVPADTESDIYYTTDGSIPSPKSNKYTNIIQTDGGKINISAIAYDPTTQKRSIMISESFDVARINWKIQGVEDKQANNIIDGNIHSSWFQKTSKMPIDITIDLGKEQQLIGFKYLPAQQTWPSPSGVITHYEFYVSADNKNWKKVSEGEFSNIKNNPLWQTKNFTAINARYIKLRALKNTHNDNIAGYSEIDIITK